MKKILCVLLLFAPIAKGESFVESFEKRFAKKKPLVGEALPDARGYDLEGRVFPLKKMRGKFTVIVSGCFT